MNAFWAKNHRFILVEVLVKHLREKGLLTNTEVSKIIQRCHETFDPPVEGLNKRFHKN